MSETTLLTAERRVPRGKGGARQARRSGRVPGIVYGGGGAPLPIAVEMTALARHARQTGFFSHVCELDVEGERLSVLPRELQYHPVSGKPLHVDFLRLSATTEVTVDVEIAFENADKCPGLKAGGVLNVVSHTIAVVCLPSAIPERFVVDLAGLEIGDVVHVDALKLPKGARFADAEPSATIASIAPPTVEAPEAAAEEGEAAG